MTPLYNIFVLLRYSYFVAIIRVWYFHSLSNNNHIFRRRVIEINISHYLFIFGTSKFQYVRKFNK